MSEKTKHVSNDNENTELNRLIGRDFNEVFRETPVNKDTQCGYSIFSGSLIQK